MLIKHVMVTDAPLPSAGQGSWSQRIGYLLQHSNSNPFDFLVCPENEQPFSSERTKRLMYTQNMNRLANKAVTGYRFKECCKAVATIVAEADHVVITIVDTIKLKMALWSYLVRHGLQAKVSLVYYHCGYSTFLSHADYLKFSEGIQEMVMLTANAYRYELAHRPAMPFLVHIVPNPVDADKYFPLPADERRELRQKLGLAEEQTHFLWAAYNRPKKGLMVVLDAWLDFNARHPETRLQVIGANPGFHWPGVQFHGQLPHSAMAGWMQACDVGISSSLWPEGFSLSLAEQISSGLLCVASTAGCVADFFVDGVHGIAIDEPNIPGRWSTAFEQALLQCSAHRERIAMRTEPPFLDYPTWCKRFSGIFTRLEEKLQLMHGRS